MDQPRSPEPENDSTPPVETWVPQTQRSAQTPEPTKNSSAPVAALVLGILGLIFWIIPPIGLSIVIAGIILGIIALKQPKNRTALVSIILCSIGLILNIVNIMMKRFAGGQ